ncbi:hypothetical protein DFJ77DRAFT_449720 [Powellomyces hirtus]|nr:hypothetical protein DFJ77DRAFT_449720 [Powellomyces hirtus]
MDYHTVLEDYIGAIENVPSDIQHTLIELRSKDEEYDALRREIEHSQTDFYGKLEDIVRSQLKQQQQASSSSITTTTSSTPPPPTPTASGSNSQSVKGKHYKTITSAAATAEGGAMVLNPNLSALVADFPDQLDMYRRINGDFKRCAEIADDKLRIAERSKELIERYLRRLSDHLDRMNENDPSSTPPSSSLHKSSSTYVPEGRGSRTLHGAHHNHHHNHHYSSSLHTPHAHHHSSLHSHRTSGSSALAGTRRDKDAAYEPEHALRLGNSSASASFKRRPFSQKRVIKRKTFNDMPASSIRSSTPASPRVRAASPDTSDDLLYCLCQQVSFGEMIACDNEDCPHEWFHLGCVGLTGPPEGAWMCPTCRAAPRFDKHMKKKARVA